MYHKSKNAIAAVLAAMPLRWNHLKEVAGELASEFISPVEFVPVPESTGKIQKAGRWVLEQGCSQVASWLNMGLNC